MECAFAMVRKLSGKVQITIGIHHGPVLAAVVGKWKVIS